MKRKVIDFWFLFMPLTILILISLFNMYKIGIQLDIYQNYLFKQALWFLFGIIIIVFFKIVNPKILFKYSKYLYFFNIFLLILVLFIGKNINGSKAWFDLGFISFQPSELMKFSLAIYLAEKLSAIKKDNLKSELKFIIEALFLTLIPSLFVFLEPDTGAIIIYFIIMFGAIIVYKINFKWYLLFAFLIITCLLFFGYLYFFNKELFVNIFGTSFFYRFDRLLTFVNNDSFQLNRALITIGSSSLLPTNNYLYIPEAPTDFIIALTVNNLGLIGFFVVMICYIIIDIYFIYSLFKTNNMRLKLFLSSFIFMFLYAQIQNIGMNLGLLPIIGLPLPFLSYGGTNTIVYFLFISFIKNNKN